MPRACRICGCTDEHPCKDAQGEPCAWVADDLCSACAGELDLELFKPGAMRRMVEAMEHDR